MCKHMFNCPRTRLNQIIPEITDICLRSTGIIYRNSLEKSLNQPLIRVRETKRKSKGRKGKKGKEMKKETEDSETER